MEIYAAKHDLETATSISGIITDNFTHDPVYSAYEPEVLRSYTDSNSPPRLLDALASSNSQCFTAVHNSQIIGVVLLGFYPHGYPEDTSENTWRIRRLHVAQACRGLGLARRLLNEAENFVAGQDNRTIYAEATPEASGLLLKHGWTGQSIVKDVRYRDVKGAIVHVTVPRFKANKTLVKPRTD